ncbi:MAG: adenylate/guanylate cyclase domain-containing protein, partial [Acidobacteria bacterium]|nr:adenylate/guanylate cyclase domain-containing protein [Acidobacteriota bacterium]
EQALGSLYADAGRRLARRMLIRFRGPVLSAGRPTYQEHSFYDLFYSQQQLLAGEKPFVDPAIFKDKIVVIGTTAPGLSDLFTTPFAFGKMPGMQIHASVIDDVLSSHFTHPAPGWATAAALVAAALLVAVVSVFAGLWATLAVAMAALAALLFGSLALFERGLWVRLAAPGLAVALATFGGVAYQYLVEGREKRKIKQLFSRYVAPDVFHHLMADPSRAKLGGHRREMTVLFSDIRGFTSVTERGQPEEIVAQLNEYFTRMVHVLFEHRGTLDKFVGDMVMALFGAPLEDPDHADHAVETALAMRRELAALNRDWASRGWPALDFGIGINTGDMVAGNIGSDTIMSYTVIGDAVNLGSRLESLNKQYQTHIIISENTRALLKGRYHIRSLGEVVVKGKTQPVAIFEVDEGGGQ